MQTGKVTHQWKTAGLTEVRLFVFLLYYFIPIRDHIFNFETFERACDFLEHFWFFVLCRQTLIVGENGNSCYKDVKVFARIERKYFLRHLTLHFE